METQTGSSKTLHQLPELRQQSVMNGSAWLLICAGNGGEGSAIPKPTAIFPGSLHTPLDRRGRKTWCDGRSTPGKKFEVVIYLPQC